MHPFRLRILLIVLAQGRSVYPLFFNTCKMVFAPHSAFSSRTCRIASSISRDVFPGTKCGIWLPSDKDCPKDSRSTHLYPVFLLIPNSRHRELKFFVPFAACVNSSLNSFTVLSFQGIFITSFLGYFLPSIIHPKLLPVLLHTCYLSYCTIQSSTTRNYRWLPYM